MCRPSGGIPHADANRPRVGRRSVRLFSAPAVGVRFRDLVELIKSDALALSLGLCVTLESTAVKPMRREGVCRYGRTRKAVEVSFQGPVAREVSLPRIQLGVLFACWVCQVCMLLRHRGRSILPDPEGWRASKT